MCAIDTTHCSIFISELAYKKGSCRDKIKKAQGSSCDFPPISSLGVFLFSGGCWWTESEVLPPPPVHQAHTERLGIGNTGSVQSYVLTLVLSLLVPNSCHASIKGCLFESLGVCKIFPTLSTTHFSMLWLSRPMPSTLLFVCFPWGGLQFHECCFGVSRLWAREREGVRKRWQNRKLQSEGNGERSMCEEKGVTRRVSVIEEGS
jgi:hypothetical protein